METVLWSRAQEFATAEPSGWRHRTLERPFCFLVGEEVCCVICWISVFLWSIKMAEKADNVYMAKLAEQAERYDGNNVIFGVIFFDSLVR